MPEPGAGTSAAGILGWKALGGAAGIAAGGAGLAALVVMLMTRPRDQREWAVSLICTVLGSICGGAVVIMHFDLQRWMDSPTGLMAVLGIVFACGLPGWTLVRSAFTWMERRHNKDLGELIQDARSTFK